MGKVVMLERDMVGWAGLSPMAQARVSAAVSLHGHQVLSGYCSPAHAVRRRHSHHVSDGRWSL